MWLTRRCSHSIPMFFHNQETQQVPTEEVSLEVLLSNGQKVLVNVLTSDQTEYVLEGVAAKLDIPDDLIGYFSLFLVREK